MQQVQETHDLSCQFSIGGECGVKILDGGDPSVECKFSMAGVCVARESDLIEVCPHCNKPTDNCKCGTFVTLVSLAKEDPCHD